VRLLIDHNISPYIARALAAIAEPDGHVVKAKLDKFDTNGLGWRAPSGLIAIGRRETLQRRGSGIGTHASSQSRVGPHLFEGQLRVLM
jgi:hypothetical protein